MSCFKLPKGLCKDLTMQMVNFWWGDGEKEHKVHWIAWSRISESKDNGGLGFKDLQAFNTALLGKQIWRVITNPNLLMSKVLKARYFPKTEILKATSRESDSWLWKSWCEAMFLINERGGWQVGNGGRISIWEDKWIKDKQMRRVRLSRPAGCELFKVRDLMDQEKGGWNAALLYQFFEDEEVEVIMHTPISIMGLSDKLVWNHTRNGKYLVKSGYNLAKEYERRAKGDEGTSENGSGDDMKLWLKFWDLNIKGQIQHFLWRACNDKISIEANLKKRGLGVNGICKVRGDILETVEHLFFHCQHAETIWKIVNWEGLRQYTSSFQGWW